MAGRSIGISVGIPRVYLRGLVPASAADQRNFFMNLGGGGKLAELGHGSPEDFLAV